MPINVFELRNWLGDPSIYVLDCSGAGALLPYFADNSPRHGTQSTPMIPKPSNSSTPPTNSSNDNGCAESSATSSAPQQCIVLAACQSHEMLPLMNPLYPADIFTACLTTPIPIAVRWFILQNPHISSQMSLDISENIPGKDGDRKTPKGELNWIFTAVADTIAWSCLPSVTFQ
jgi:regulator-associated protein of mTOR